MKVNKRFITILLVLLTALFAVGIFSVVSGGVAGYLFDNSSMDKQTLSLLLIWIRLPRVLLAIAAGGALALSGLILQAVLKNPLAEPYVLGTSSGAATGAVLVMVTGVTSGAVILGAGFLGAIVSIFLVLYIARYHGTYPVYRLIVSGIVVHSLFSSVLMVLITMNASRTAGVMHWLLGSLSNPSLPVVAGVSFIVIVMALISYKYWRELNLLSLGDEEATSAGLNVSKMKIFFVILASVMTGSVVAVSGIIGFVGIIVPHTVRMLLGGNHRYGILPTFLAGSLFLLIADTGLRVFSVLSELPIGVITSLSGAPFFILLLERKRRKGPL